MRTKYPNRKYLLGSFIIIFLLFGCKKFVEVPPPTTQIVTASVYNSSSTATSALISVYTNMYNNGESYNIAYSLGLLSDELTNYSAGQSSVELYTNRLLATDDNGIWDHAYLYIYQANALMEGVQNNGSIVPAISQQLAGEAKFIRAFWHFYLTNEYGAVPIVTTTDYSANRSIFRSEPAQVYSQIITDLTDAVTLLNSNYVDASDTTVTTDRIRPNKATAEALLARTYLYTGKYDSAEAEATLVINNSMYGLCTNLSSLPGQPNYGPNSVFAANSSEAIWQLGIPQPPGTSNTLDATDFILVDIPQNGSGTNSSTISPQLFNAFEPGDERKTNWIGVYTTPDSPVLSYYYPYKYQSYNTTDVTEYTMVLRLAEQYLIRAEAAANLGDMTDAAKDLNTIRARAGLPASAILTSSSTLAEADSAILHERQVELFTEWGHRWLDMKRMGVVNQIMGAPGNVTQYKGGVWNPDWALFPIPQNERTTDPNLTQNVGY